MATEEQEREEVDTQETGDAEQAETPDFLGMSDEDILNMDLDTQPEPASQEEEPGEGEQEEGDTDTATPESEEETPEGEEAQEDGDQPAEADESEGGDEGEGAEKDQDGADAEKDKAEEAPDYEKFYRELTAPFNANGKEFKVDNVEDARRLMQMGANYNKKMTGLKPHMKTLKLLENNGLLDEQKLSFYIDVEKKDPAAIAKLIKDSGIDPQELDLEQSDDYKANTYTVDDREVDLDNVLDELKDSTHYNQILDTVSTKWDQASKQIVSDNPAVLRVINDHMASGVYDLVSAEVEKERVLGRLNGLSDLEAYREVGEAIEKRGDLDHLFKQDKGTEAPAEKTEVTPAPKADEADRKSKKRAARKTNTAAPSKKPADFNPLAISDDEFEKQFDSQLM